MSNSSAPRSSHEQPSSPDERDFMLLSEIQEGVLNVKVLRSGQKAIVIRRGEMLRAFGEICPHMGADLSEAKYSKEECSLQCRWHGYVFSAEDGKFLRNPNEETMRLLRGPTRHFAPTKTPRYRLTTIPTSVKDGRLFFGREEGDSREA